MTITVPGSAHDPEAMLMTAWWQRPEPDRPAWRTRAGPPYPAGDPFLFAALAVGRWPVPVREVAPGRRCTPDNPDYRPTRARTALFWR